MWIVSYDLSDDKLRRKLFNTLNGYGQRVQYSVFAMDISVAHMNDLRDKLSKITMDNKFDYTDSIIIVPMCKSCKGGMNVLGSPFKIVNGEEMIVV